MAPGDISVYGLHNLIIIIIIIINFLSLIYVLCRCFLSIERLPNLVLCIQYGYDYAISHFEIFFTTVWNEINIL